MLPPFLLAISIAAGLRSWPAAEALASAFLAVDAETALQFSYDFGRLVPSPAPPAAVLRPSSPDDIADLLRLTFSSPHPFPVAARGNGHSIRGQALAPGGVVVDMAALGRRHGRINVSASPAYVDAGGEQLWIDVLRATLEHGFAPRSWTDYLHLTVGGTLSNAGVSGQAFRHGPQISNVYEVDIITGRGEMVTCSPDLNSDLFYGALGGLGQLGIITRARIAVEQAPTRVRWVRLIYTDFAAFTDDQERLISITDGTGFDYVEGSLLMDQTTLINNWRSSFFSGDDSEKIKKLASQFGGAIYCLEAAVYYDEPVTSDAAVDEKLASLLRKLRFVPGFVFAVDATYLAFLDRVREGELRLRAVGLWDVPHPWLNLFVPKSSMHVFESGVFKGILKANNSPGPVLIYPMNKNKWDERMSAVTPNEEIFYSIGLLRSATSGEWQELERQNEEILGFCHERGIELKQYLPHYTAQSDWARHFGHKWDKFVELKKRYDPKAILSPGQQIFTTPDADDHQDYSIDHLSVN